VAFLAKMFKQYRGGFRLRFKFVKTEFHSGRYMFSYIPAETYVNTVGAVAASNLSFVHRDVCDLRFTNECCFDIPYASVSQYRPTTGNGARYGYVHVHCINPLQAPSSVSSSVKVLVEVSGMPDLEYAIPAVQTVAGVIPYVVQCRPVRPQGYGFMNSEFSSACGPIGGSREFSDNLAASRMCMGERVLSLRFLAKMCQSIIYNASSATVQHDPNELPVYQTKASGGSYGSATNFTVFDMIRMCCALERGGVRFKAVCDTFMNYTTNALESTNQNIVTKILPVDSGTADYVAPLTSLTGSFPVSCQVISHPVSRGGVEVQCPFWCRTFCRPVQASYCNSTAAAPMLVRYNQPYSHTYQLSHVASGLSSNFSAFYKAASDDFQAGLFVGVPLLCAQ